MKKKSKIAYKTISEAAHDIGLINIKNKKPNTHTLRFWEKKFKQIKPKILFGNRRYYSNKDMHILKLIYNLLKKQGMTIKGVKNHLLNDKSKLDLSTNPTINTKNILKTKINKISKIIKELKK